MKIRKKKQKKIVLRPRRRRKSFQEIIFFWQNGSRQKKGNHVQEMNEKQNEMAKKKQSNVRIRGVVIDSFQQKHPFKKNEKKTKEKRLRRLSNQLQGSPPSPNPTLLLAPLERSMGVALSITGPHRSPPPPQPTSKCSHRRYADRVSIPISIDLFFLS